MALARVYNGMIAANARPQPASVGKTSGRLCARSGHLGDSAQSRSIIDWLYEEIQPMMSGFRSPAREDMQEGRRRLFRGEIGSG